MTSGSGSMLGRFIAEGRTAEVFAYGDDRVVKLLRPGFSEESLRYEAVKTNAAVIAGGPAPRVHGEIESEGRMGMVFDRVEGPSLLDEILRAPHRFLHWGSEMARAHRRVLDSRSDQLFDVRVFLTAKIKGADPLDPSQRRRIIKLLDDLPDGDHVLHGDLHPLNVFLTSTGPMVIDWVDAARGSPAADIARSLWLVSPHAIPPDFPRRALLVWLARGLRLAYLRSVLRGTGIGHDEVRRWRLPVLAGRLSEGIEHEERPLLREVGRLLESGR